jgi:hypothetical protein
MTTVADLARYRFEVDSDGALDRVGRAARDCVNGLDQWTDPELSRVQQQETTT